MIEDVLKPLVRDLLEMKRARRPREIAQKIGVYKKIHATQFVKSKKLRSKAKHSQAIASASLDYS